MSKDGPDAVVHQLAHRRLTQASTRVLDAVTGELAEVRARTGSPGSTGSLDAAGSAASGLGLSAEFELGLRDVAVAAGYQASLRTAVTIRQRSLAEFLR
jgi:hypothetical protein